MVEPSNPAGGNDLQRRGKAAAAEPGLDGSVGSYLRRYAPMGVVWSAVLGYNVYVFIHFHFLFALLYTLTHTVPVVLLTHFPPDLLGFLDDFDPEMGMAYFERKRVARETSIRPAALDEEEEEYVIVHNHDAMDMHHHS